MFIFTINKLIEKLEELQKQGKGDYDVWVHDLLGWSGASEIEIIDEEETINII